MHNLGEAVATWWADHVGAAFVPGGVLDLSDQRLDLAVIGVVTEVQADRVEQPSPGAHIGQQGNRACGTAPGSLLNKPAYGLLQ